MKFNILVAAVATFVAAGFASCSDGDYWDGPTDTGTYYAFPKPAATVSLAGSESMSEYSVPVTRNNTGAQETLTIAPVVSDPEVLSVPTSVTFPAGQTTADLVININESKIVIGQTYTVKITLPGQTAATDSVAIPAGNKSFTFSFKKDWVWKNIGWVPYTEDFVTTFYGVSPVTYYVPIEEAEGSNGIYRLVNAYGAYYPYNEPGDYSASTNSYMEINAQDPQKVYITQSATTMNWGEGNFVMFSLAGMRIAQGNPAAAEGSYGTLANGKITFPARTLLVAMADYNDGGFYYANSNGAFCVDLGALTTTNPY